MEQRISEVEDTIFQIDIFDQSQNYDGQLLSALRFLNSLILKSEENPEEIIIKAEAIPLLMEGFANQNQIIQYESIYLQIPVNTAEPNKIIE